MESIAQTVGLRIRVYRQRMKMTQEELAEKADVHHTYIGQVERGEKNLTIATLEKILKALNVSFTEFFECMDFKKSETSIASQCYNMINSKDKIEQEKIYKFLCDIEDIMSK